MEDWLINYYEQTDPLKRQQMLLENKNETMSEEDKLRMKLWETRYGKGKPRKDMFVGYLMNLKYIVESGSMDLGGRKKKLAIEAILGLNLYEFERKPKTQQEIIFLELKNTCRKYIEISTGGRGFTSVIFGMGQLIAIFCVGIRYHMNIQIRYAGNQAFRQGGLAENILSCNGTSSNYDF